jgi:hypothetical protein
MRLVSKREQDKDALIHEILEAGDSIFAIRDIAVLPAYLVRHASVPIALCGSCGEAYPQDSSGLCPECRGKQIYS